MACCSAYTEPTFKQIALSAGISKFYTKPLGKQQMQELASNLRN